MSGLVAVIANRPGTRIDPARLDGLVRCYESLRGEVEYARRAAGSIGVAALLGDRTGGMAVERDGESWAISVGGVHAEHGGALDAPPEALDGQFALLRYDARTEELELLSDPFGLQALYVADRGDLSFVSTSVLVLAKHLAARPDRLGLETFLRSGPHFGEITNWRGIERVQPATRRSYGRRGSRTSVYWRPTVDPSAAKLGLEAASRRSVDIAVDCFRDRFASQALTWCDLSGGYDTRLAALLLDRAGVRFWTTTNGDDDEPDAAIATQVAALGGWSSERGRLCRGWPEVSESLVPRAIGWGDGILEATQLTEVLALQSERARTASVLFNGGGGEHWRDYAWKQEMPLGGRTRRVRFERWVDVRFLHPIETSVFKVDPTPRVRDDLIARCRAYAAPYAEELNSVQLDVLYAYKAMAHFGAYQSAARGTIQVELPFYAKRPFEAAFSVAPRHRNLHRLARAAIALLDPRVAALPTTHGDLATPLTLRNAHQFFPFVANRALGAARKLTQNLPGPTIGALRTGIPEEVQRARIQTLDRFVRDTGLEPARMRAGSLYDGQGLLALAGSPHATTAGWRTLGPIITAERALEAVGAELE
jgi:hypothetical protein